MSRTMNATLGILVTAFVAAGDAAGAVVSRASGKGAYLEGETTVSFHFNAGLDDVSGPFGSLIVKWDQKGKSSDSAIRGAVRDYVHNNPTGYVSTTEYNATFAGVIEEASDPSLIGKHFRVFVQENHPDEFGIEIIDEEASAANAFLPTHDVVRGSIHVH